MNKQKIKVKKGFEQSQPISHSMEPVSELQRKMKLLSAPYKYSNEYKFFQDKERGIPNYELGISSFWDTNAGYIDKYENCDN